MGDASTQSQGARNTLHVQSVQHRENEGGENLIRESPFARSCTREGVRVQHSTLVQLGAPEDSKEAPASRTESVSDTCKSLAHKFKLGTLTGRCLVLRLAARG